MKGRIERLSSGEGGGGGAGVQDNFFPTKYRGYRGVKANRIAFLTDLQQ